MTTHPNCKINLGLHVVSKRPDGYHNLESIFLPVALCDDLSIDPAQEFSFVQDGIPIDGDPLQNLVVKAYTILRNDFPLQIGPVAIRLTKKIPFGAGLGGGSADASFALRMLSEMYSLNLTYDQLCGYAAKLGSDCPFFIGNRPVYATGTGNELADLDLDLSGYRLVLLKPDCGVSTAEAYRGLTPRPGLVDLREAVRAPITEWRHTIVNHFEESIFPKCPQIASLKQYLYDRGALYASMSGSGSTVYGFFDEVSCSQFESLDPSVKVFVI